MWISIFWKSYFKLQYNMFFWSRVHIFHWGSFYYRNQLLPTVNDVKQNKQEQLWQIPWSLTCIKTNQDVLLDSFYSFDLNKELNMEWGYESKKLSREGDVKLCPVLLLRTLWLLQQQSRGWFHVKSEYIGEVVSGFCWFLGNDVLS